MPDHDKLQQLFNAALKSQPEDYATPPAKLRAVPTPAACVQPTPVELPRKVAVAEETPAPVLDVPRGLKAAESEQLGVLLDDQVRRRRRKHRMEALVTALVLFSLAGGGLGWFVQDKDRVQAFQEALRDVRSVGDIKALVASYKLSLDRIATRSNQIDGASMAMGIDPAKCQNEDPCMEAEMKQMMGGDGGPTVGSRNKRLMENFGHMAGKNGVDITPEVAASDEAGGESFGWSK
jgi:hypothetical protein